MLEHLFANLATGFAAQFGAPYVDAIASWSGVPTLDAGGSIISSTGKLAYSCKAQFDVPTQAMRQAEGFLENDARILVLSASLAADLNIKAKINVASGENAGAWELLSCVRDPAGIGYECRGRLINPVPGYYPPELSLPEQGQDW